MTNRNSPFEFDKDDLLVVTTRPPLSDDRIHHNRPIYRSEHMLEDHMLARLDKYFENLSRELFKIKGTIAPSLKKGFENRAMISFYLNVTKNNKSAGYKELADYKFSHNWLRWKKISDENKSCAFLILDQPTDNFPKLLYLFGMGGQEGLIFSKLLRQGLWDELKVDLQGKSRIVMVEFSIDMEEETPLSFDFIKNIKTDVVLDHTLD